MKPRNGLAKDQMIPRFSTFQGFQYFRSFQKNGRKSKYNGFISIKEKRVTCWIVPVNACRSINSDDPCYLDQFWKIQVISMTDVSHKPPMCPLPCMSKCQQYHICQYKIKKPNAIGK